MGVSTNAHKQISRTHANRETDREKRERKDDTQMGNFCLINKRSYYKTDTTKLEGRRKRRHKMIFSSEHTCSKKKKTLFNL